MLSIPPYRPLDVIDLERKMINLIKCLHEISV